MNSDSSGGHERGDVTAARYPGSSEANESSARFPGSSEANESSARYPGSSEANESSARYPGSSEANESAARYPGSSKANKSPAGYGGQEGKARDPKGGSPEAQSVLEQASGGLDGAVGGVGGDVPVRTDDAVGASQQVRANARTVAPISAKTRVEARQIIARYPRSRSALLPMLHLVQSEQGYVTPDGVAMCAEELGLTKAEVGAVATFYTMFKRRPTGDYLISVCTNTLCGFLGGEEIYTALSEYLGVGHDQTTADGQITLEHAECLAACDYAPVVTVNYEFYDQQDTESALNLVTDLQRGERPQPTRGAPLSSFLEISRELAGFVDPITDEAAVNGPSAGEPTLAGNREALRRGDESPAFDADTPIVPAPPKETGAKVEETPAAPQSPSPAPEPEPEPSVDPEPEADASPEKAFSTQAEQAADNEAEAAGARAADPDAEEQAREPGTVPDDQESRDPEPRDAAPRDAAPRDPAPRDPAPGDPAPSDPDGRDPAARDPEARDQDAGNMPSARRTRRRTRKD